MTTTTAIKSTTVRSNGEFNWLRLSMRALNAVSPSLARRYFAHFFFRPARHAWPAEERVWKDLANKQHLYTAGLPVSSWDGQSMQVYRWGKPLRGKVIVMHGWSGRATQFYGFIDALVQQGFEVIGIDAPGHGDSEGKMSTILHFANAISRLVRNEGAVEALVAHSFGGAAAVFALASQQLAVKKAVLIAPSADVGALVGVMAKHVGMNADWAATFGQEIERTFGVRWPELNAAIRATTLTQPALIIHDEDDKEVAVSSGRAIGAAWCGAKVHITQGLGHRRILKNANVINEVVEFVGNQTD